MPQCPSWCARQNGWNEPEFQAVLELIEVAAAELGGDESHTYLAGQSMGGAGAWKFAATHPDTFAAMVAMCSYCPLKSQGCPAAIAHELRDKPVWIFHAANDVVIPVEAADEMAAALRDAHNNKFKYTRYPWGPSPPDPRYSSLEGHAVHDLAFVEPDLATWLLQWSNEP
jgi:predicted peptidase